MRSNPIGRRTALNGLATGVAVALAVGSVAGSRAEDRRGDGSCRIPPDAAEALARRPGTYLAVADRIVDGAHLVILLEEDGRVVDQVVVPAGEYPYVDESDRLVVTLDDGDPAAVRVVEDPSGN